MSCYLGVTVPPEALGFPHDTVSASAFWFEVFLQYPLGAFLGVFPFCPAVYLVPEQVVESAEGFCTHLRLVIVAPSDDLPVEGAYDLIGRCGSHPFYGVR